MKRSFKAVVQTVLAFALWECACCPLAAANPRSSLLNDPVDLSGDFRDFSDIYYLADTLTDFDPVTGAGKINYQRAQYSTSMSFNHMVAAIKPVEPNEFPADQYAANPSLPFAIEFVSPRTFRIRLPSGPQFHKPQEELMLVGEVPHDDSWKYGKVEGGYRYTSAYGSVTILENPWHLEPDR